MPTLLQETEVGLDMSDLSVRVCHHVTDKAKRILVDPRSTGIHLMDIVKYCAVKMRVLKPGEPIEEELPLWPALGFAWEEFCASLYPDMFHQPGEQCRDGVYGTPDGRSLGVPGTKTTTWVLEEFKLTRKKCKHEKELLRDMLWMWQLKGYCCMLGVRFARLHVCYINGEYKPMEAKYLRYLIEFQKKELDDFWAKCILPNIERAEEFKLASAVSRELRS